MTSVSEKIRDVSTGRPLKKSGTSFIVFYPHMASHIMTETALAVEQSYGYTVIYLNEVRDTLFSTTLLT